MPSVGSSVKHIMHTLLHAHARGAGPLKQRNQSVGVVVNVASEHGVLSSEGG